MELQGKTVIALGERDGIPGPTISEIARAAGATEVRALTQCFV